MIANEDSYECFFIYEGDAGEAGEACLQTFYFRKSKLPFINACACA